VTFAKAVLAGVVLVDGAASPPAGGQHVEADRIVDEDYRFELRRPGPEWSLLSEASARSRNPDAVAGITRSIQLQGLVLVHAANGRGAADLSQFGRSLPNEAGSFEVEREAKIDYAGAPAVRIGLVGTRGRTPARIDRTLFRRDGFIFELFAIASLDQVDAKGSAFDVIHAAFDSIPGAVVARPVGTPDFRGVGWRVRDGIWESASYGLAWKPCDGMHVATGAELVHASSAATAALIARDPALAIVLFCKRQPGVDAEMELVERRKPILAGFRPTDEHIVCEAAGRAFDLLVFRDEGPAAAVMAQGLVVLDDVIVEIQVRAIGVEFDRGRASIPAALAGLSALRGEEFGTLATELLALADPQNCVGSDWSLRRGCFLDFENGFEWRKPPGFWTVWAGDEAAELVPGARLVFDEPMFGVTGAMIVDAVGPIQASDFHEQVLRSVLGGTSAPMPTGSFRLGTVDLLVTKGRSAGDGAAPMLVATACAFGRSYVITVWGTAVDFDDVTAADAAATAVAFGSGPGAFAATTNGVHRDLRLGFELAAPSPGWEFVDDPRRRPDQRYVAFKNGGSFIAASVFVDASRSLAIDGIEDAVRGSLASRLRRKDLKLELASTQYGGEAVRSWRAKEGDSVAEFLTVRRDSTWYSLIVVSNDGSIDLERAKGLFKLID